MAVEFHRVVVDLVNVNQDGEVLPKNSSSTSIADMKSFTTEYRILSNAGSPLETPSSEGFPTIDEYLAAEALLDFQFAYMDQFQIVTQKLT